MNDPVDPYEAFELWAQACGLWVEFLASDSDRMHEIIALYAASDPREV